MRRERCWLHKAAPPAQPPPPWSYYWECLRFCPSQPGFLIGLLDSTCATKSLVAPRRRVASAMSRSVLSRVSVDLRVETSRKVNRHQPLRRVGLLVERDPGTVRVTVVRLPSPHGYSHIARILLNKGANVSIASDPGLTPWSFRLNDPRRAQTKMLLTTDSC